MFRVSLMATILVVLGASGCSSFHKTQESDLRAPSASAPQKRAFVDSPECTLQAQDSSEATKESLSALTGYAVGPVAASLTKGPVGPVLRPFSTDGCSSSPEGVSLTQNPDAWAECCVQHDTFYWLGGTAKEKQNADHLLEACISKQASPKIGEVYRTFVDRLGGPDSRQSFRWGYGWNYKRPYSEITPAEEAQLTALYGVKKENFSEALLKLPLPMQRMCNYGDPVFSGFMREDALAYEFLNRNLKQPDQIVWARKGYFNRGMSTIEVKLLGCHDVVTIYLPRFGTTYASKQCSGLFKE